MALHTVVFTSDMQIADMLLYELPSLAGYLQALDTFKGSSSRIVCK